MCVLVIELADQRRGQKDQPERAVSGVSDLPVSRGNR